MYIQQKHLNFLFIIDNLFSMIISAKESIIMYVVFHNLAFM